MATKTINFGIRDVTVDVKLGKNIADVVRDEAERIAGLLTQAQVKMNGEYAEIVTPKGEAQLGVVPNAIHRLGETERVYKLTATAEYEFGRSIRLHEVLKGAGYEQTPMLST